MTQPGGWDFYFRNRLDPAAAGFSVWGPGSASTCPPLKRWAFVPLCGTDGCWGRPDVPPLKGLEHFMGSVPSASALGYIKSRLRRSHGRGTGWRTGGDTVRLRRSHGRGTGWRKAPTRCACGAHMVATWAGAQAPTRCASGAHMVATWADAQVPTRSMDSWHAAQRQAWTLSDRLVASSLSMTDEQAGVGHPRRSGTPKSNGLRSAALVRMAMELDEPAPLGAPGGWT